MDTDLIYQFRTVMECGTIAQAAVQLNMTPGALSRAIKRLESELDCSLFTPSGRNILPTKNADYFYSSSNLIIESIDNAKKILKTQKPTTKDLKLSTFEVFSTHFISWMIQNQKIDFPLTVHEATPGNLEENILTEASDFGLTYIPIPHKELDHLVLGEMPISIFVSQKAKNKNLPYATPITEIGPNPIKAQSLDGWPIDIPRDIQYKFEMLETALDLTSRGHCRILCPKFLIQLENERLNDKHKLIEVEHKMKLPKFRIYAVKRKTQPENTYFKKLCKAVRVAINF